MSLSSMMKNAFITNADMQICPYSSSRQDKYAQLVFWGLKVVCIACMWRLELVTLNIAYLPLLPSGC